MKEDDMPNEKFILTPPGGRELHLGFIKETFRHGAVIEHDEASGRLIVDGRRFDDTRDLDLLKKHGWVIPYSEENLAEVLGEQESSPVPTPKPKPGEGMEIVQSDEDSHETIDISHTQVSKRNQEAKEEARTAAKNRETDRKMEIIKGDESVEERIARLSGKTDMTSVAERVRLKRQHAAMPIVHDDSLGAGVGMSKSEIPLNAGQQLPSREEVEAKTAAAKAEAAARKKEVEKARSGAGIEVPSENAAESTQSGDVKRPVEVKTEIDQFQTPHDAAAEMAETGLEVPKTPATASDGLGVADGAIDAVMAENDVLRAENAELKGGMAAMMARLDALEAKPEAKSEGDGVERTPVTDPAKAEEVLAEKGAEG
jgi:hypothetical protein